MSQAQIANVGPYILQARNKTKFRNHGLLPIVCNLHCQTLFSNSRQIYIIKECILFHQMFPMGRRLQGVLLAIYPEDYIVFCEKWADAGYLTGGIL